MRNGPKTDQLPGHLGVPRMPSLGEQIKYPIKLIKIKHDAGSWVKQWHPIFFAI